LTSRATATAFAGIFDRDLRALLQLQQGDTLG